MVTDIDGELVEAITRQEPDAAGRLIDRHGTRIYRVARRFLRDPRDAEEVTQDVLMAVMRKIRSFRGAAAFSSWVFRITANAASGKSRRSRRRPSEIPLEADVAAHGGEGGGRGELAREWSRAPDEVAMAAELKAALEQKLRQLPTGYRAVVVLHGVEGLPNEEIAGILGLSLPAVKSRLHRARLILRKSLGPVIAAGAR